MRKRKLEEHHQKELKIQHVCDYEWGQFCLCSQALGHLDEVACALELQWQRRNSKKTMRVNEMAPK